MNNLFQTRTAALSQDVATKSPEINLNRTLMCRYCKVSPPNLVDDFRCGDCICADCGLVIESGLVDVRPEWRNFNDDEVDPSRIGPHHYPFIHGPGLESTDIGPVRSKNTGDNGNTLKHFQILQARHINSNELSLERGRIEIRAACDRMDLSRVVAETAMALHRQCLKEQLQRGRSHAAIIAAAIALATRECNCERTIDVVAAKVPGCGDNLARKAFKAVKRQMRVSRISKVNPEARIDDICKKLGLNRKVRASAEDLMRKAHSDGELFGSSKAVTKAAVCVFVAAMLWDYKINANAVVKASKVTPETLKRGYHTLRSNVGRLVDVAEWTRRWGEGLNVKLLK